MNRTCIYCGLEKPVSEFSLEHIFPDSLGGALCNERFKTNSVCQRCNSICGIWVDAPVIKNWFSNNYKFDSELEFVDLQNGSTLPFRYMGVFEELNNNDIICEFWLGPCGDSIYHFRNKADDRFDSMVGGDFIDIKKNPGTAYLLIATDNMKWAKTVLFSFKKQFEHSRRIACNLGVSGDYTHSDFFDSATLEEKEMIERLKLLKGHNHKVKFSTQIGFDQRFLCKVALGIGYNLFGEDYLLSNYALELRKGLWEKDVFLRSQLKIRCTSFNYEENTFWKLICYKSAHAISLLDVGNLLVVGLCLYGKMWAQITISDEKRFWKDMDEFSNGIVYLVFPQLKEFIGPYDIPSYLAHKTLEDSKIEELEMIEKRRIPFDQLPPFRSENYDKLSPPPSNK